MGSLDQCYLPADTGEHVVNMLVCHVRLTGASQPGRLANGKNGNGKTGNRKQRQFKLN